MINTKTHFYAEKKPFKLFGIKNDFAKYFAKFCNLFKYFVSHIMIISINDTFLYYRTNQISLCYIISTNAFLGTE